VLLINVLSTTISYLIRHVLLLQTRDRVLYRTECCWRTKPKRQKWVTLFCKFITLACVINSYKQFLNSGDFFREIINVFFFLNSIYFACFYHVFYRLFEEPVFRFFFTSRKEFFFLWRNISSSGLLRKLHSTFTFCPYDAFPLCLINVWK